MRAGARSRFWQSFQLRPGVVYEHVGDFQSRQSAELWIRENRRKYSGARASHRETKKRNRAFEKYTFLARDKANFSVEPTPLDTKRIEHSERARIAAASLPNRAFRQQDACSQHDQIATSQARLPQAG